MYRIGLLVYDFTLHGGAEKVALKMAQELNEKYEIHFLSCFSEKDEPILPLNERIKTHVLSEKTVSIPFHLRKLSSELKKYLVKNEIDVLLSITAGVNTIAFLGTTFTKTKMIYAEHSNLLNQTYGKKHLFRQWIGAKTADAVVTLTEADRKAFVERFHIGNKCQSIYNWFDGEITSNAYDWNSKKIMTVGRLVSVKGYDRLLEVAKLVFEDYPDWSWDIYGEGHMREQLERTIQEYNLERHVFLKGKCPDVLKLYNKYSFFVMTSYYEGLPLVLEAKSGLLPIVSFDCPTGPSEIICDGYDGYLVENNNISQMVERIKTLIGNQELRMEFSKNSVKNIKAFEKKTILNKWINLIESLCKEEGK